MSKSKPERAAQPLTDREAKVLSYIARCIDATGCQPSYREICAYFKWNSVNSVASIVVNCMAKGAVWKTGVRGVQFSWRDYL